MQVSVFVALSAGAAAITQPGSGKSLPTPPRNEQLEGSFGDLKCVEAGLKESVDVFGPLGDVWVNETNFVKDGGTKDTASSGPATAINSAIAKPSNETSGEDAASYWPKIGKKEIYEILQGALAHLSQLAGDTEAKYLI